MRKMAEYIDKQTVLDIIASFRTPYRKEVRIEDVYDAVDKAETVTINDTAEEIKVTNCNHIAEVSKKVSISCDHENGLIDRRQAIEAYGDWYVEEGTEEGFIGTVKQLLEGLPSVQPTYTDEQIQKMQDLEQAQIEKAYQLGYEEGKRDAQPERKSGKWIEHNPHKFGLGIVFECSECGEKIDCEEYNFCPHCGARMVKDGEEE